MLLIVWRNDDMDQYPKRFVALTVAQAVSKCLQLLSGKLVLGMDAFVWMQGNVTWPVRTAEDLAGELVITDDGGILELFECELVS